MKTNLTAIFISVAIIISAFLLGNAYIERSRAEGEITVTGLGKKDFSSDLIVWEAFFYKVNMDLKIASSELNKDKKVIEDYLEKNGIDKKDVVFSAIEFLEQTKQKYSNNGEFAGEEFVGYKLTQSIQLTSKDIDKIEGISRNITELLNDGIQLYSNPPRYYFTKLADLKIELVSEATEDARNRAEKISEKSGCEIGNLTSAQMGIFQITGQNSDEEYSWGGTFNTASKEKSALITMKLSYKIK